MNTKNIQTPDWISTEEAEEISGYKADYIRRLVRDGKIDSQKVFKTVLINRESLMSYKAEQDKKRFN